MKSSVELAREALREELRALRAELQLLLVELEAADPEPEQTAVVTSVVSRPSFVRIPPR